MNHINIFSPYRQNKNTHENELTRSFLILLKNIPLVQAVFFEIIRKNLMLSEDEIESFILDDFYVEEIHTQISNDNIVLKPENIEGRRVVSVLISDDTYESQEEIKLSKRRAIYDAVLLCSPSWLFVIENKPYKENVWAEQLNPNIHKDANIKIIKTPCCLSWRNIIESITLLLRRNLLNGVEKKIVEDFLEYIDSEFKFLNPYTNFVLCKDNQELLDKRCRVVMGQYQENTEVKYHRGWKSYIDSGNTYIRMIALDSEKNEKDWNISLWMYAGVTMVGAKEVYENIDLNSIIELQKEGFILEEDFHFSYRASGLLTLKTHLSPEEYLRFWKENYKDLKQIKKENFAEYFLDMVSKNIFSREQFEEFSAVVLNKNYPNLNICPGLLIKFKWDKNQAIVMDEKGIFEKDFKDKVNRVLNIFKM